MSGYLHPLYAEALACFGAPRPLPASGGYLLVRPVPGSSRRDAMGCYPLFACRDWSRLADDLVALTGELVAVSLVADPFGDFPGRAFLERCFGDRVLPFKEHSVVDLAAGGVASAHHRRNVRKAARLVEVERCAAPGRCLDDWLALYGALVERHRIRGIPAFCPQSFARQFAVPGLAAFRAIREGETVGMTLWYVQGEVGYYHLGASSPAGYAAGASFALFDAAIRSFREEGLAWLDLGAGAGLSGDGSDGLVRFKQGWATGTRTAWFCGRILDREAYSRLAGPAGPGGYFPAYRRGEFG